MLLSAREPCKLELPDEPNRYYMALPKGDIELKGISDWYDETTIEFLCQTVWRIRTALESLNLLKIQMECGKPKL